MITTVVSFGAASPEIDLRFTRREIRRALDRCERLGATAFRCRVERALERVNDVLRGERRAVVERDAAAKMERVRQSVWRDVPAFGERRARRARRE